jgi:23S rRNA (adenine2030-N6)-methyltransferase
MLSYRHSYHAGNFADVLKHSVQTFIIEALKQKPKPFVYIDTHAGAGRYDLTSEDSNKVGEYKNGIELIHSSKNIPQLIQPYLNVIHGLNTSTAIKYYPGSPLVAQQLIGRQNRMELSELHPTDFELLGQEFKNHRNIRIQKNDGYKALLGLLPPIQRRGLILIDPPYELKDEYNDAINAIKKAYKLFSTGIYALWYPVVDRMQIEQFCNQFKTLGIKKILRIEMNVREDSDGYGMTGTGMIVINPPWKLLSQMGEALPWLLQHLKQDQHANFKVEWLVPE